MFSIGEFSKICGVTTRTLRHYDTIGLLKPIHTDAKTGYRFYDISQLRQLLLITRLKDYNFSLDEIAVLISTADKSYVLNQITAKKQEIRSKINQYKSLERQLELDILSLKKGADIMSFIDKIQVTLVETKSQYILHSRQRMSVEDYGKYIGKLYELAYSENIEITGAPISIYHDKEFDPAANDTEVALPVQTPNQYTRILSGGLCATAIHTGAYSQLPHTYAKLVEWIAANDYKIISPPYEQYLKGPMEAHSSDDFITQIYFPITKSITSL